MPDDLSRLLAAALDDAAPAPDFAVVTRRVRRRSRQRLAVAGTALLLVAGSAGAVLAGSTGARDTVELAVGAPVLPGSVAEPRPYDVPTTAPTATPTVVLARPAPLGPGERSVPWRLERLWDGGLAIRIELGCEPEPPLVRLTQAVDVVLVQVVDQGGRSAALCDQLPVRAIALDAPLGDRVLLHAPTPEPGDGPSLEQVFEGLPEYPGSVWSKDGREVPVTELVASAGPSHCQWQGAVFLGGDGIPAPRDDGGRHWTRDPKGVLTHFPQSQAGFRADAVLPSDAVDSGYRLGTVELWTSPADAYAHVWLVNGLDRDDVERWVRGGGGCA